MKRLVASIFLFLLLVSACSLPSTPDRTQLVDITVTPAPPTRTPTPPTTYREEKGVAVWMYLVGSTSSYPRVDAGSKIALYLKYEPEELGITRRLDGTISQTTVGKWKDAPQIKEMQVCFAFDNPCQTDGRWVAYNPDQRAEYLVDWLGPRTAYASTRLRDAAGASMPVFEAYRYKLVPEVSLTLTVVGQINAQTPLDKLPSPVLTAAAATKMAFPVTGSVVIEEGRSAAGGTAGSTISLKVQFSANSVTGKVTEMRVRAGGMCQKGSPSLDAPWEPFVPEKSYSTTLAINWVGYSVGVQYRDAQGNLSPVYCDDISLEGMPARTP